MQADFEDTLLILMGMLTLMLFRLFLCG